MYIVEEEANDVDARVIRRNEHCCRQHDRNEATDIIINALNLAKVSLTKT